MVRICVPTLLLMLMPGWTSIVQADDESKKYGDKIVLFGNLHAHSKLSKDVKDQSDAMLPIRAFEYADEKGLDFLAISDHHKADDSPQGPKPLRIKPQDYQTLLFDAAMNYNANHVGEFVAIPAIEWGNIATGNHINLIGADALPPDSIKDVQYEKIYTWAKDHCQFVQFNHPYSWAAKGSKRNKKVGNFGEARYDTDPDNASKKFVSGADAVVKTCSIICTVAGGHIGGKFHDSDEKTHRDVHTKAFRHYKKFLNKGFHLAPSANQDTHGPNWGTVTAARTAVWADDFTYKGLMAGFKKCRTYATEDDELAVVFQVRANGRDYWMGETVPLRAEEVEVVAIIKVWQTTGSDSDSTDEGPYTVSIFSDADGFGGREASIWTTVNDLKGGREHRIPLEVVAGEYIFVEVTEQKGKDNEKGDGDDEFNNNTGTEGADDKRDDMNDSAWTAPVWFDQIAGQGFVWSKRSRSKVYHDSDCWSAKRIGSANRRSGPKPPEGWKKHDCRP